MALLRNILVSFAIPRNLSKGMKQIFEGSSWAREMFGNEAKICMYVIAEAACIHEWRGWLCSADKYGISAHMYACMQNAAPAEKSAAPCCLVQG